MSKFKAKIIAIESVNQLNLVSLDFEGSTLQMMSLGLDDSIRVACEVLCYVKPTAVMLAKDFRGELSSSNRIVAEIKSIEKGKLLSSVRVQTASAELESIITSEILDRLGIKSAESVTVIIKESDISILEVVSC